ncbi:hypothetical protein HK096_011356 [Nowakowskiella sp. JEL0078]|nr:hypothetical protein HK096_011356 [Nowakowskiella sp. JEL0078]
MHSEQEGEQEVVHSEQEGEQEMFLSEIDGGNEIQQSETDIDREQVGQIENYQSEIEFPDDVEVGEYLDNDENDSIAKRKREKGNVDIVNQDVLIVLAAKRVKV